MFDVITLNKYIHK